MDLEIMIQNTVTGCNENFLVLVLVPLISVTAEFLFQDLNVP